MVMQPEPYGFAQFRRWLQSFEPVISRLAKEHNLPESLTRKLFYREWYRAFAGPVDAA